MSHNWLHTPDCMVLNESTYKASGARGCLSTHSSHTAKQRHTIVSQRHINRLLDNSQSSDNLIGFGSKQ